MKKQLILPASILVAGLVVGGFIYASQVNKSRSIEKQQQIEINEQRRSEEAKLQAEKEKQQILAEIESEKETTAERLRIQNKIGLESCLAEADQQYNDDLARNGSEKDDEGTFTVTEYVLKQANNHKQTAKDNCYKKYE